eukprot:TRINITY_DN19332_c0_g1::TRINITY_DN19332_c0_g1_i1::g.15859::m.15859 TRINITY_DN19332_c0_g1::TRINITY_DN19332_c0_g1_i1::g.15859  ORF type:complete len:890 (-),score=276.33,sp/P56701/PSMD2_BOVIN/50.00/0.0,PC_rep/PF01851.17/1.5e+04,PC_rep/PF01851.17/40,PC_rep/PF01851.17/0.023,PC_rep/PF01851.17/0.00081,PC_rep/PF01851.17/27,PC_rep/PF01851.17/67,PC_rep/PF01851.17/0.0053,PC_rep/PF01851.17/7.7e+02,HEAT_2/PF13646.1/15,HEAT_2/PF13646.1/11,HEAT_2/PF13646.1/6,HEAT_2/PF13646.1/0.053 TRINITY_DN19332_c0_g1_i1:208-
MTQPEKKQPESQEEKPKEKKNDKNKVEAPELSEEDKKLKETLELLVERAKDPEMGVQKLALETLVQEIKSSTSTMTSVPKPLKFLRPFYPELKEFFNSMPDESENKPLFADILSVLALTLSEEGSRDILKYRLLGSRDALATWGHEYVRSLSGDVGDEFQTRRLENADADVSDLMKLVDDIIPFYITQHSEPDACDLLLEVEDLPRITQSADKHNYNRICLYLISCSYYLDEPDQSTVLKVACEIYRKVEDLPNALRVAFKLNDKQLITDIYNAGQGPVRKQLALMLARQDVSVQDPDEYHQNLINNTRLIDAYWALARDLEVMEPKVPDDIYKTYLQTQRPDENLDSARLNLASSFVNGFVNLGFGSDKLMTEEGNKWLYKNKDHGMLSTAASVALIKMWDVDSGLAELDKYLYATDDYIKAGALLGVGIVNARVHSDVDPAMALLSEHVESSAAVIRLSAIQGLGMAYAGTCREDVLELLTPVIADTGVITEIAAFAALSAGLIFVGSCHDDAAQTILAALMERDPATLNETTARYFAVGLGLLYLGKQDAVEATVEVIKTLSGRLAKYIEVTVDSFAYACSGNVLKVQQLLTICAEHEAPTEPTDAAAKEEKDLSLDPMGAAVIGIALVACGEEIGTEMVPRALAHIMQYAEPAARRAVPLALSLLFISNPNVSISTTLHRLTHDQDTAVAQAAMLALGFTSAGTNNSRVAGQLRQLAEYYTKDSANLFLIRLAQGFTHMGKGLVTLDPIYSDRFLHSPVSLGGLVTVLHSCLDIKKLILGRYHSVLYYLSLAISPRMLITIDEDLKMVPITVRVGQAIDVVAQAGKPKSITGFQTHTSPVILAHGDRAEFASEEYIAMVQVLEGVVIIQKNPDYVPPKEEDLKKK